MLKIFTHKLVVNNLVTQGITSIFTKNFVGRNRLTAFGEAEKKFKAVYLSLVIHVSLVLVTCGLPNVCKPTNSHPQMLRTT